jgi:hypothetical protein
MALKLPVLGSMALKSPVLMRCYDAKFGIVCLINHTHSFWVVFGDGTIQVECNERFKDTSTRCKHERTHEEHKFVRTFVVFSLVLPSLLFFFSISFHSFFFSKFNSV